VYDARSGAAARRVLGSGEGRADRGSMRKSAGAAPPQPGACPRVPGDPL